VLAIENVGVHRTTWARDVASANRSGVAGWLSKKPGVRLAPVRSRVELSSCFRKRAMPPGSIPAWLVSSIAMRSDCRSCSREYEASRPCPSHCVPAIARPSPEPAAAATTPRMVSSVAAFAAVSRCAA
jgi:hypothetical protein